MTVGPDGVRALNSPGAVVSLLVPDKPFATNIVQNFCHLVHFFSSPEAGERWMTTHAGTLLLSVEDAHELGQRTNRAQFADALPAESTPAKHDRICGSAPRQPRRTTMATRIELTELQRLRETGAQVVEVLPDAEYRWAHLPGALNIPLKQLDAETTARLERTRDVVVYCHDYL